MRYVYWVAGLILLFACIPVMAQEAETKEPAPTSATDQAAQAAQTVPTPPAPAVQPASETGLAEGAAEVIFDFTAKFNKALVINAKEIKTAGNECAGNVTLPGFMVHPLNDGDAKVAFGDISVPEAAEGVRSLLVFQFGFRNGIPWSEGKANGAQFSVSVNNEKLFDQAWTGEGWQARAIDVSRWAGQGIAVEFATNPIEGNTNYDWCIYGQPLLIAFRPLPSSTPLAVGSTGIALAEVKSTGLSKIKLSAGAAALEATIPEGVHLLPAPGSDQALTLETLEGTAELVSVSMAAYLPDIEIAEMKTSTPLITAGRPFNVVLTVKNNGLGQYPGGSMPLEWGGGLTLEQMGSAATQPAEIPPIAPGKTGYAVWRGLVAEKKGSFRLSGPKRLNITILDSEPATPPDRPEGIVGTALPEGNPIRGIAGNAWSRLCVVAPDDKNAYAIAETWNGSAWQRVASLFPLVQADVVQGNGECSTLEWRLTKVDKVGTGGVALMFEAAGPDGAAWMAALSLLPNAANPYIQLSLRTFVRSEIKLAVLRGPSVLAGDHAFGAQKEFALFPGLEYLEGDEPSSSDRDLAPPLNNRQIPAAYKITCPLMAVQGQDALVALLWDANQNWYKDETEPAARFVAPAAESGMETLSMDLFVPSVGKAIPENSDSAVHNPLPIGGKSMYALESALVLDHKNQYETDSIVLGSHKGGLLLQSIRHWMSAYGGTPEPSAAPRDWEAERALCREAYANAVWSEDPAGWRHCAGHEPGLYPGQAVPQLVDIRAGVPDEDRKAMEARIDKVIARTIAERGAKTLWNGAGCHIVTGELPYYAGYTAECLDDLRAQASATLKARENGLWVWRPSGRDQERLGKAGDHTLGQAALGAFQVMRAARLTGDPDLIAQGLEAIRQMESYEVPRGAQTWECPLYQPDILAAAYAVRAYCEAYRVTGDTAHLAQARYWAWTGLPFVYFWESSNASMRYNTIPVFGSTFYTHSWIGTPVVWCGLVYAYGLQDLAEFDDSMEWKKIAQGITRSAMIQQYTDGPSKGCYPDSWDMVNDKPNPADINPENILMNQFRLTGPSPEIRCARLEREGKTVMLNAATEIQKPVCESDGTISFALQGVTGFPVYATVAPVPAPKSVKGCGNKAKSGEALRTAPEGWQYDEALKAVVIKVTLGGTAMPVSVTW